MKAESESTCVIYDPHHLPGDDRVLGGKGKNLAFLSRLGVPVPQWICIPSNVIESARGPLPKEVTEKLDAADHRTPQTIRAAAKAAQAWILSGRLSDELLQLILARLDVARDLHGDQERGAERFFAVRSSAAGEDAGEHSFAGQFETQLYVPAEGLAQAVVACMASAYSERVLAYLSAKELSIEHLRMAVIVQKMWPSERAGVLFTCNPEGRLDEMTVVGGLGLGEGVVSDLVESDQFTLDRSALGKILKGTAGHAAPARDEAECGFFVSSSRVATKRSRIVWDSASGRGTVTASVPTDLQQKPVLTPAQLYDLAQLGLIVEEAAGHPQDIEWGLDAAGEMVFLQTRPITSIPRGKSYLIDNSNVSESYPGVSSRLTFSVVRKFYQRIFLQALESAQVSLTEAEQDEIFGRLVLQVQGRIFYNLSNWYEMLKRIPGAQKFVAVWEEMLGIRPGHAPSVPLVIRLGSVLGAMRTYSAALKHLVLLNKKMRETHDRFLKTSETFWQQNRDDLSASELLAEQERLTFEVLKGWEITLWNDGFTFIFAALSKAALRSCGVAEPGALLNDLLSGETEMESARSIASAQALAKELSHSPRLRMILSLEGLSGLKGIEGDLEAEALAAAIAQHLDRFGDRTMGELKLETVTFRERPDDFVRLLLALSEPDSAHAYGSVEQEFWGKPKPHARQSAERALQALLKNRRLVAPVVHAVVAAARMCMRHRENSRFDRARAYGMSRAIFRTLGKRLVEQGVLQKVDHVFLYSVEELEQFIAGQGDLLSSAESEKRLSLLAEQQEQNPEDRFWIRGEEPDANVIPQKRPPNSDVLSLGGVLRGVGSSAGKVTAEGIVLDAPHVAADVRGKVLVTRQTDPGWVFLMVNAAGLVSEKGSILSHTAIIGRELGVPTVVGVSHATALLKTGDVVSVDGAAGTVTRASDQKGRDTE